MRGHELKKALADVVARRSSEAGQRAAVQAVLVSNGHSGQPDIRQERVDGVVTRLYVWDGTPWGAVVLQAGPSIVPTVLVEGVDAELARAPESRSSARGHASVVERDNPAKGPDKSLIASPEAYGSGTEEMWLADIVKAVTGIADKYKSIEINALAAMFRFYLTSMGLPAKVFSVTKESTYLADHRVQLGGYGLEKPTAAQLKLFGEITGWSLKSSYDPSSGEQKAWDEQKFDVTWYASGGAKYSSDPYSDYPYQGAGGWLVPAKYGSYVGALVAATAKANGIAVLTLGEVLLAAGKKVGAVTSISSNAKSGKPVKGAVTVAVIPGGAGGVYVQGDTYAVKDDIIKPKALKWAKFANVSGVPEQSWYSLTGSPEGALTIAQGLVESLTAAGLSVTTQGFAPAESAGASDDEGDDAQVTPLAVSELAVGEIIPFVEVPNYPGSFFARVDVPRLVYVSITTGMEVQIVAAGELSGYPTKLSPNDYGDKTKFAYLGSSFQDYPDALDAAKEMLPDVYAVKTSSVGALSVSGAVPAVGASLTPLQAGGLPETAGFARKTPSGVIEAWYRFNDGSWGMTNTEGAESYNAPAPNLIPAAAWGLAKFLGEGMTDLSTWAIMAKAKEAFAAGPLEFGQAISREQALALPHGAGFVLLSPGTAPMRWARLSSGEWALVLKMGGEWDETQTSYAMTPQNIPADAWGQAYFLGFKASSVEFPTLQAQTNAIIAAAGHVGPAAPAPKTTKDGPAPGTVFTSPVESDRVAWLSGLPETTWIGAETLGGSPRAIWVDSPGAFLISGGGSISRSAEQIAIGFVTPYIVLGTSSFAGFDEAEADAGKALGAWKAEQGAQSSDAWGPPAADPMWASTVLTPDEADALPVGSIVRIVGTPQDGTYAAWAGLMVRRPSANYDAGKAWRRAESEDAWAVGINAGTAQEVLSSFWKKGAKLEFVTKTIDPPPHPPEHYKFMKGGQAPAAAKQPASWVPVGSNTGYMILQAPGWNVPAIVDAAQLFVNVIQGAVDPTDASPLFGFEGTPGIAIPGATSFANALDIAKANDWLTAVKAFATGSAPVPSASAPAPAPAPIAAPTSAGPTPLDLTTYEALPEGAIVVYVFTSAYSVLKSAAGVYKKIGNAWVKAGQKWGTKKTLLSNVVKKGKVYLVSTSPLKAGDATAAANQIVAKLNASAGSSASPTPAPTAPTALGWSAPVAPKFPEGTVTTDSAVVAALPLGTVIKIDGGQTSTYPWEGFYYRAAMDSAGDVWVKAATKGAWAFGTLLPPHAYLDSELGAGSTVTIVKYATAPTENPPEYYAGYLAGIKDAAGPASSKSSASPAEKITNVADFAMLPTGTVLADYDGDMLVVTVGGYFWLTEDSFFPEEANTFGEASSLLPMTVIGQQPSGVPIVDYVKPVSTPGPNTTMGFDILRWTGGFPAASKMQAAPKSSATAPSAAPVSAVTSAGPATAKAVGPWGENPVPVSPAVGARKPADRWNSGVAAFCAKLGPVDVSKKGGSNPGGIVEQPKKTYVKWPKTSAHVASEVLAAQLYRQVGARAPDVRGCAVPKDGDPTAAVLSPWYDKYRKIGASDLEKPLILDEIAEAYLISAWLGNYDVVGLEFDNLLTNGTDVLMVDAGGSLFFRAQGGVKTDFNGGTAGDLLTSLLNAQYPAGQLFTNAGVTQRTSKLREVADRIGEMSLDHLKKMAGWAGFTGATVDNLAQILVERGKTVVAKYGTPPYVAPAPKPKVKGPPAGALITDGESILLTKRAAWLNDGGVWSIPAGSADVGETPVQTALREAKEELGGLPPGLKPVLSAEVDYTGGKKFVTVVFVLPPGMKAKDWRPWTKGVDAKYANETDGWAWVGLDELDVETDIHGAQRVVWRPRLHVGLGEPVAVGEGDYDGETKAILALAKEHLPEWAAGYASGGAEVVEEPWTLGTEGIPIKKSNPSGYALSGVQETKQGQRYVEYRPRMADGSRPRIRIPVDSVVVGAEQVAQEVKHSIKGVKGGMKLTSKKVTAKTALIAKDGVWLPGDLDDAFEPMLSRILGIAEPTRMDVHMAAVLAAAGLPLNEATPEIAAIAKAPETASFGSVGSAKLTKKQGEIVQSLYKSLVELLGDDPKPTSTSGAKDPALAKKIKRRMQGAIVKMRAQSTGDYGSASSTSYEYPAGMPRGPWVGGYLRLLVEAKLAGLWRERLDPGKRVVYRTLKHVDSSPSFVWDVRSKAAYEAMKAANVTATPATLPAQGSTAQVRLFTTWIGAQINGPISFAREDAGFVAVPHSKVVPPSISGLDGGLSFNKAPYGQVTPLPSWADEPWAQVAGFPVGFANYLYIEQGEPAEASHWQVGDSNDEPGWTGDITLRTTADSDPGFVMLPSFLLEGTSYDGELEVEHVHMSEAPMPVEVVRAAGNRLTKPQLKAFNRCHPAYPPGFEGPFEKRQRLLKSNPAPMRANPAPANLVVQSLLFDRNAFSPTQARAWAQGHGYRASNEAFDITDRFIRVRQRDPDDFDEGSFITKTLRAGVKAVMAREL